MAVAWRPSTRPCPAKKAKRDPDPTVFHVEEAKKPTRQMRVERDSLLLVLVRVNQVKPAACGLCYVFCHGAPGWGWVGGTGMSCKIVTGELEPW